MTVFDYLKAELRARNWSMTDLARKAGVSKQIVSQWLAEDELERITPGPKSCEKIAEALGADLDYVLELAGHRKPRLGDLQPDASELFLKATTAEMADVLRGAPRVFWPTLILHLSRAVDSARDVAELLAHLGVDAEAPVSPQPVPPVSKPRSRTNSRSPSGDGPLAGRQHRPLALLGAT